ncbi:Chsy1 [Symbiodinium sp. CCMP2592]|nr:Chsy1 [Symbiodinium sp. CCMP2592]
MPAELADLDRSCGAISILPSSLLSLFSDHNGVGDAHVAHDFTASSAATHDASSFLALRPIAPEEHLGRDLQLRVAAAVNSSMAASLIGLIAGKLCCKDRRPKTKDGEEGTVCRRRKLLLGALVMQVVVSMGQDEAEQARGRCDVVTCIFELSSAYKEAQQGIVAHQPGPARKKKKDVSEFVPTFRGWPKDLRRLPQLATRSLREVGESAKEQEADSHCRHTEPRRCPPGRRTPPKDWSKVAPKVRCWDKGQPLPVAGAVSAGYQSGASTPTGRRPLSGSRGASPQGPATQLPVAVAPEALLRQRPRPGHLTKVAVAIETPGASKRS